MTENSDDADDFSDMDNENNNHDDHMSSTSSGINTGCPRIFISEKNTCSTHTSLSSTSVKEYFTMKSDSEAVCKLCKKTYKHNKNTTNMRQHLLGNHSTLFPILVKETQKHKCKNNNVLSEDVSIAKRDNLQKINDGFSNILSYKENGKMNDKVTSSILYMIAVDLLPLSTVEKTGFRALMKTVAPLYAPPSVRTITRLIESRYITMKQTFIEVLKNVSYVSLTCDIWDDVSQESYLGITVHYISDKDLKMKKGCLGAIPLDENHTADYILHKLKMTLKEFQLDFTKITAVVSDCGANVKKSIIDTFGIVKHIPCFAHQLALLLPDTMKLLPDLQIIITKVRNLVVFFRRSTKAANALKNVQANLGDKNLKLILDCTVRWNSTLYMIDRFIQLEQYVYSVISNDEYDSRCDPPLMLSREEVKILKDVLSILNILELATKEISGDSYPTCSLIIPLVSCIRTNIEELTLKTSLGNDFKNHLLRTTDNRLSVIENKTVSALSTFLDPRFKKKYFKQPLNVSATVKEICAQGNKENIVPPVIETNEQAIISTSVTSELWKHHDRLTKHQLSGNFNSKISEEISRFLSQPIIERKENPMQYWNDQKRNFPLLYNLGLKYCSLVGTSVSSERLFSKAGLIKTDQRNRLSSEHLNELLFLSTRPYEEWQIC